jgi:hypothetical protein
MVVLFSGCSRCENARAISGLVHCRVGRSGRKQGREALASDGSGVSAIAILLVTMGVSYDAGLRHVLIVFPLLAVIGGFGAAYLWQLPGRPHFGGRALLAALLLSQGLASFAARSDYIAYFNPLAGNDPSQVLITGCDLDCGQDLYRLADAFRAQHVSHVYIAMWSSAELSYMGLPAMEVLPPFHPVTGWGSDQRALVALGPCLPHRLSAACLRLARSVSTERVGGQDHPSLLHSA